MHSSDSMLYMDKQTMFIRSVPADVALAFKLQAITAGKSHGEWLAELVRKVEGT